MTGRFKTNGPVSLSEDQILALHEKLRVMRHDVNGRLANMVAAAELIRMRPESTAERLQLLLVAVDRLFDRRDLGLADNRHRVSAGVGRGQFGPHAKKLGLQPARGQPARA